MAGSEASSKASERSRRNSSLSAGSAGNGAFRLRASSGGLMLAGQPVLRGCEDERMWPTIADEEKQLRHELARFSRLRASVARRRPDPSVPEAALPAQLHDLLQTVLWAQKRARAEVEKATRALECAIQMREPQEDVLAGENSSSDLGTLSHQDTNRLRQFALAPISSVGADYEGFGTELPSTAREHPFVSQHSFRCAEARNTADEDDEDELDVVGPIPDEAIVCWSKSKGYKAERRRLVADLWQSYDPTKEDPPDFFEDILIAPDGGFCEVGELWHPIRWLSAIYVVLMTVANVCSLVYHDWPPISKAKWRWIRAGKEIPEGCVYEGLHAGDYLLSQWILEKFTDVCAPVFGYYGRFCGDAQSVVCVLELIMLFLMICRVLLYVGNVAFVTGQRAKWISMSTLFWKILPELCTYSAMRLLHFVTPAVVLSDVYKFYIYSTSRWHRPENNCWQWLIIRKWLKLIITRTFFLVIGLDAFLTKIGQANFALNTHSESWMFQALNIIIFIMQILGIVQLAIFVRERIFLFIFGGEDAIMQPKEKALQQVWEALLARTIFEEHGTARGVALMLSFDDADFQKLVLNERQHDPENVLLKRLRDEDSDDSGSGESADGDSQDGCH